MLMHTGTLAPSGLVGHNFVILRPAAGAHMQDDSVPGAADVAVLPAIIWSCDAAGRCISLSSAWSVFTGRSVPSGLDWGFLDAVHPDDRPAIARTFERARDTCSNYQVEYRLVEAGGAYRWVMDTAVPDLDPDGSVRGFTGAIVDNSARRDAEERLRERERELRLVTDTVPVLIAHVGNDQRYLYANSTYRDWYGVESESLVGKSVAELLGPERYAERVGYVEAALRGERVSYDGQVTLRDGRVRDVETIYVPNICSAGKIEGFIAVVTDITDRKRTTDHLNLVSGELRHHVRNLLTVVQGIAQRTFATAAPKPALQAFQGRIRALSAATDAITPDDVTASEVSVIAGSVVAPYRETGRDPFILKGGHVTLPTRYATSLAMVLHELCTNAVKYGALSASAGTVQLAWQSDGQRFELEWIELGGPPVAEPDRRGFGTMLLTSAFPGGETRLEYRPEGLCFSLRAPLGSDGAASPSARP